VCVGRLETRKERRQERTEIEIEIEIERDVSYARLGRARDLFHVTRTKIKIHTQTHTERISPNQREEDEEKKY
jgi:hypothetical protein